MTTGDVVPFHAALAPVIASELSGVRSFVFVEGVDEVTDMFGSDRDFEKFLERMGTATDV